MNAIIPEPLRAQSAIVLFEMNDCQEVQHFEKTEVFIRNMIREDNFEALRGALKGFVEFFPNNLHLYLQLLRDYFLNCASNGAISCLRYIYKVLIDSNFSITQDQLNFAVTEVIERCETSPSAKRDTEHLSDSFKKIEMLGFLLECGSDLNFCVDEISPIRSAITKNQPEVLNWLIVNGAVLTIDAVKYAFTIYFFHTEIINRIIRHLSSDMLLYFMAESNHLHHASCFVILKSIYEEIQRRNVKVHPIFLRACCHSLIDRGLSETSLMMFTHIIIPGVTWYLDTVKVCLDQTYLDKVSILLRARIDVTESLNESINSILSV